MNMLDTIVWVGIFADKVVTTSSVFTWVLYFVYAIKISTSFPTFILVISRSVTFC